MIKKLFISRGYFFAYLLVAILLLTIFNYFKLFGMGFIRILKFLLLILGVMIFSYLLGKKSVKNGYLEGAKFGGSIVFVFLLISLISKTFEVKALVYYLIIMLVSILSSMFGINHKKDD